MPPEYLAVTVAVGTGCLVEARKSVGIDRDTLVEVEVVGVTEHFRESLCAAFPGVLVGHGGQLGNGRRDGKPSLRLILDAGSQSAVVSTLMAVVGESTRLLAAP